MRRIAVLWAALLLMMMPRASAGSPWAKTGTHLSVLPLTSDQLSLVQALYPSLLAGESPIDLPGDTRYDDVTAAMNCLLQDYPELLHLSNHYTVSYYQHQPDVAVAVTPGYLTDAPTAQAMRSDLLAAAQALLARSGDPLDLHDALLAGAVYDNESPWCATAYGALVLGRANCEGYARALTLLYRMAGVPCGMVTGTAVSADGSAQRHAWNLAYIGGPTLIDATWNDQDGMGRNTHWYYGLSTAQMAADHTPDPGLVIPWCADQDNWHALQGFQAHSAQDVYRALAAFVHTGEPVNLRIHDAGLYASLRADLNGFLDAYNQQCPPEDCLWGGYTYAWSDAQQCLLIARPE